jgi:hypothetical protein
MSTPRNKRPALRTTTINRLNAYAIAAGAAGVSLIALAPPADAEIVYTPTHATVGRNGSYGLDLNNDGIVDFMIRETAGTQAFGTTQELSITPRNGNEIKCRSCVFTSFYTAAALNAGSHIGPVGRSVTFLPFGALMALRDTSRGKSISFDLPWANVQGKFLGLRFHLSDGDHFGWARVTVQFHTGSQGQRSWNALITGYAYETVPNKPIEAGHIGEGETSSQNHSSMRPALGSLALGAGGIAMWRRENN